MYELIISLIVIVVSTNVLTKILNKKIDDIDLPYKTSNMISNYFGDKNIVK